MSTSLKRRVERLERLFNPPEKTRIVFGYTREQALRKIEKLRQEGYEGPLFPYYWNAPELAEMEENR